MTVRIQISVAALARDGLVLLGHRHPSRRWYPDCWDLVGGHVEPGELPHQAVARECLEELGVQVHDPLPIPMTVSDPTLVMHAFLVTRWEGEPVNAAPDEHDDLRWFRPGDLAGLTLAHPASLSSILSAVRRATSSTSVSSSYSIGSMPTGDGGGVGPSSGGCPGDQDRAAAVDPAHGDRFGGRVRHPRRRAHR